MVTLKQLAKELNVSISTVSKALNDSEEIGEHTIKRVKELAEYYNYQPNKVALSLKINKTNTIGVIIPNILNRFFAKVLVGIEEEASRQGYNIITCMSDESLNKEKESLQLLANGSVDGFILSASQETQKSNNTDHLTQTISRGLPVVMFDRVMSDVECDKVIIDDIEATYKATQYLIDEGRNTIAFISNVDDLNLGKLREEGYNKALKERNFNNPPIVLKLDSDQDEQLQMKSLLEQYGSIDGIIAADNVSGLMAINMATHMGFKIPKDISIIGFADETTSKLSTPKLTSINQNADDIGKNAIRLLIDRLKKEDSRMTPRTKIIDTSIELKGSTLND
jgi:LacI family transcriptional regulator